MHGMHPLCKILNTPVMSICLVKQNDGTWIEKHLRFLFNVYKRFFLFLSRFYVFLHFFLERFFTSMAHADARSKEQNRVCRDAEMQCWTTSVDHWRMTGS